MATGSAKTIAAANLAYRLVTTADAERVLFLVDRLAVRRPFRAGDSVTCSPGVATQLLPVSLSGLLIGPPRLLGLSSPRAVPAR